jgi:hypothetical protein
VIVLGKAINSIEIEASPEKVFDFAVSDKMFDLTKEWVEGKKTSDGPVGLGSTVHFSGVKFDKGGEWNAVVTEFTENKSMTMSLKGANRRSNDQTNYYLFEPTSKGTKLTITMDYKVNRLLDVLFVHRMIDKENMGMLEMLKKTLES